MTKNSNDSNKNIKYGVSFADFHPIYDFHFTYALNNVGN